MLSVNVTITIPVNWLKVKLKADIALPGDPHLRATGRHLPYGITQCYLPNTYSRTLVTPQS